MSYSETMNVAGDYTNCHLSALDDENLHWDLACNYPGQIFPNLPPCGEKVWSHSDVIHSPFQGKTILLQLWLFTIFHSIFRFFLVFTFSRFFDELLAWRLQWNYFIKIFDTDLLGDGKFRLFNGFSFYLNSNIDSFFPPYFTFAVNKLLNMILLYLTCTIW